MNEHPEWTADNFTEHGNALSETIWLECANQFFGYDNAASNPKGK
jgi:hypothetical protein